MNPPDLSPAEQALRDAAREYHRSPTRGKISVTPTKPLSNQRDLSLAYSPGVAYPCLDIERDPSPANFLNRQPLPSITGFPAKGPMSPSPRTAVPLVMTPTRLPREVYSAARLGSASMARQA